MKKALLLSLTFLLIGSVGYCQEQKQSLQLTIKSDKQVSSAPGEEIVLSAIIENTSPKEIILFWNNVKPLFLPTSRKSINVYIPVNPVKDVETLYIKPKGFIKKEVRFSTESLTPRVYEVTMQYNIPAIVLDFETSPNQEIFMGLLTSNLITIDVANTDAPPLQATIKSDKQTYKMGESIKVEYSVKNVSKYDAWINKYFMLGANLFFEFTDENGNKSQSGLTLYIAGSWLFTDDNSMVLLKPGEVLTGNVVQELFPLFDYLQKGKWEMRALIAVYTKSKDNKPELFAKITSNPITVEVKEKEMIAKDNAIRIAKQHWRTLGCDIANMRVQQDKSGEWFIEASSSYERCGRNNLFELGAGGGDFTLWIRLSGGGRMINSGTTYPAPK